MFLLNRTLKGTKAKSLVIVLAALLLLPGACAIEALAHATSTSYSLLDIHDKTVEWRLTITVSDLNFFKEFDSNSDLIITQTEVQTHRDLILTRLFQYFQISSNRKTARLVPSRSNVQIHKDTYELVCNAIFEFEEAVKDLSIHCTLPLITNSGHVHLARITYDGLSDQALFHKQQTGSHLQMLRGVAAWTGRIRQFLVLGLDHIFTGWDHILFLVTLLLVGSSLKRLIWVVTSFTVAHSLTLILASLDIVNLSPKFVEPAIAISISYTALENLLLPGTAKRWMITFCFGLIHGFGFAGVLKQMGLPKEGLMLSLFSFNLGVEIGQLLMVLLLFPSLVYLARFKWQPKMVSALSLVILVIGYIWFFERAL
ncbi:MAG: HupE/UreJ family protein [Acidobacteria bacterium]|nr:HupE/UreJ family protein [Acidobacteriota bacterium]MCI0723035.1 HupE/UreJ family protein [Acidobacteriota bacterium]